MKLNDQSRQWLYQEAATGNETAKNALRDVNEMELHISIRERDFDDAIDEIKALKKRIFWGVFFCILSLVSQLFREIAL